MSKEGREREREKVARRAKERSRWTDRRKGDGSREEGKKCGGSLEEDEGGSAERDCGQKRERERKRVPSSGPKAAKEPLKKTA